MAVTIKFDPAAKRAASIAKKRAATMVTEVTLETKKALRVVISTALADAVSVYDTARMVKTMVGLTSNQAQAAYSYRQELINNGMSLDRVVTATDRYARELLTDRGEAIARTEIMDALNRGQEQAWTQAQDKGLLGPNATKMIILSDDPCEICRGVEAEGSIPIAERFSEDGPPFHPRCECTEAIDDPG